MVSIRILVLGFNLVLRRLGKTGNEGVLPMLTMQEKLPALKSLLKGSCFEHRGGIGIPRQKRGRVLAGCQVVRDEDLRGRGQADWVAAPGGGRLQLLDDAAKRTRELKRIEGMMVRLPVRNPL